MKSTLRGRAQQAFLALCTFTLAVTAGCGLPGPPEPPSLDIPAPATSLRALRIGNSVTLDWTDPKDNTDRTPIRGALTAQVCRELQPGGCDIAGTVQVSAGTGQTFEDRLPAPLTIGSPHIFSYRIRLLNRRGASAGLSEPVRTVAGTAPPAIEALEAVIAPDGVLMKWKLATGSVAGVHYRVRRTGLTAGQEHGTETTLEVDSAPDQQAKDRTAKQDRDYSYTVQAYTSERLLDSAGPHYVEADGAESGRVTVRTNGAFAPSPPTNVDAVGSLSTSGPVIDLNWEAATGINVTGYIVMRSEKQAAGENPAAIPVSPVLAATAWRDTGVKAGATYIYSIVAVDASGLRSSPSQPVAETAPLPF